MRQKFKKTTKEYETEYKEWNEDSAAYTKKFTIATQPEAAPKVKKVKKVVDDEEGVEGQEGFATVGKGGKTYGIGSGDVFKSLAAIQEARGKKVRICLETFISQSFHLTIICFLTLLLW